MRSAVSLFLALLTLTAIGAVAMAGEIHPGLADRLARARSGELFKVIVHMAEQAPVVSLDAELSREGATLARRHLEMVDALKSAALAQEDLKLYLDARLAAGDVRGYTSHWISSLIVVVATGEEIEAISIRGDVALIEPDFQAVPIAPVGGEPSGAMMDRGIGVTPGQRAIRAPETWYELGITGRGVLVGSVDSGVDGAHPALTDRWRGNHAPWQECWLDVINGTPTEYPEDTGTHGTHTCGTITGVAFDDSVGVAIEAEWIATNVIGQGVGSEFDNDVIAAYEWLADPDGDPLTMEDVPDVVQNSWGVNENLGYDDCSDLYWSVIDNVEAVGVVTIWSAGNEGSGAGTLRSPADRAATLTNCFSVGAVNATDFDWPYPIAGFSSRGPSGCVVPPGFEIKPEVVAPGVNVYSTIPGGGYGNNSGTSMSGPHVAGAAALLRQADPNLSVDAVKEALMLTALDEGDPGEDNTFGHGFIDVYAAVEYVQQGFGTLRGAVTNGSAGNAPLPDARVELVGDGWTFYTDAGGDYDGKAAPNGYTARASFPGFTEQEFPVTIVGDAVTVLDFSLTDNSGPFITEVSLPETLPNTAGPYAIEATIVDFSGVNAASLFYRVSGGGWTSVPMLPLGVDTYRGEVPMLPANSTVDYYVWAEDGIGLSSVDPPTAPTDFYTLLITAYIYTYDAEDPGDPGWRLGIFGDNATAGLWIRADPVGSEIGGIPMQPEDDHTPDPGVKCFVTGNADNPDDSAHSADVDGGCTTLLSPVFDLTGHGQAFASYWRLFATTGITADDDFVISVSPDNGSSWVEVERIGNNENSWRRTAMELSAIIPLTDSVVFRFLACDENLPSLVEAAVDDFSVEGFTGSGTAGPAWQGDSGSRIALAQSRPNPFRPGDGATRIAFTLPAATDARLAIYDISGRMVGELANGAFARGAHELRWDGRDARGKQVSSGIYFYRLTAGEQRASQRLVLIR